MTKVCSTFVVVFRNVLVPVNFRADWIIVCGGSTGTDYYHVNRLLLQFIQRIDKLFHCHPRRHNSEIIGNQDHVLHDPAAFLAVESADSHARRGGLVIDHGRDPIGTYDR
jgi:hypothetical protein